jgi:hypothetical protein
MRACLPWASDLEALPPSRPPAPAMGTRGPPGLLLHPSLFSIPSSSLLVWGARAGSWGTGCKGRGRGWEWGAPSLFQPRQHEFAIPPPPPPLFFPCLADATVLDAGVLYEVETDALYNVSSLFRLSFSTVAVSAYAVAEGCNVLDGSPGQHNVLAVRRLVSRCCSGLR